MGLDDLPRLELLVPLLALLFTVVVSGPASFASFVAWKWSLARIADRRGLIPARVVGVVALLATGAPVAYSGGLMTSLPGLGGTIGLLCVTALGAAALVHAAYRAECIRAVANDGELSDTLSRVPHAGNHQAQLEAVAAATSVPRFSGTTKRRALILAGSVLAAWVIVAALLAVRAKVLTHQAQGESDQERIQP